MLQFIYILHIAREIKYSSVAFVNGKVSVGKTTKHMTPQLHKIDYTRIIEKIKEI